MILIAGPCQLESRDHCLMMAERIAEIAQRLGVEIIFKTSFDKANRTDGASPRGMGLSEALGIFSEIRDRFGLRVTTDVHEPWQCSEIGPIVDVVQIPALLSRQTDLIHAAAATGKIVNIKRGPTLVPTDVKHAVAKARRAKAVWATERGAPFGHEDMVVDMRSFSIMEADALIFDATHSVQTPGSNNGTTGGSREFVEPLALAAIAAGADGLFIETHDDPDNALSDGPCMLPVDKLSDLLNKAMDVKRVAH